MNQVKIGNYIATKRKAKMLRQNDLALALGVSINAVSKWERGINMPDIAKIEELCQILDISLNELFKGEDIKETELQTSADNNVLNLFKDIKTKEFKLKIIKIALVFVLVVVSSFMINYQMIKFGLKVDPYLAYVQVYDLNDVNIKGEVDINYFISRSMNYDIGANRLGYAVFKDPKAALKTFKHQYAKELKIVAKEFNLTNFNSLNKNEYKAYAWQSIHRDDYPNIKFISNFLDIYENSFN